MRCSPNWSRRWSGVESGFNAGRLAEGCDRRDAADAGNRRALWGHRSPRIRPRTSMPAYATSRICSTSIRAMSRWRWRPTTPGRARWPGMAGAFRRIVKPCSMYRRYFPPQHEGTGSDHTSAIGRAACPASGAAVGKSPGRMAGTLPRFHPARTAGGGDHHRSAGGLRRPEVLLAARQVGTGSRQGAGRSLRACARHLSARRRPVSDHRRGARGAADQTRPTSSSGTGRISRKRCRSIPGAGLTSTGRRELPATSTSCPTARTASPAAPATRPTSVINESVRGAAMRFEVRALSPDNLIETHTVDAPDAGEAGRLLRAAAAAAAVDQDRRGAAVAAQCRGAATNRSPCCSSAPSCSRCSKPG
jgi:hypothetical protein